MSDSPISFIHVLDQSSLALYFSGRPIMAPVLSEKAIKNHSTFTAILDKIKAYYWPPGQSCVKFSFSSIFITFSCFFVFPFQRHWANVNSRERTTLFH